MKTDSQLQLDVLNELRWEPRIDHANIGELTGRVKGWSERRVAERRLVRSGRHQGRR